MSRKPLIALALVGLVVVAAVAVGYPRYREHARDAAVEDFVRVSEEDRLRLARAEDDLLAATQEIGTVRSPAPDNSRTAIEESRRMRKELRIARNTLAEQRGDVRAMATALRNVDRAALTEFDAPLLAGESEDTRRAERTAAANGAYLRDAERFVAYADRVLVSLDRELRLSGRFSITLTAGLGRIIGDRPDSTEQLVAQVAAVRRRLTPMARELTSHRPVADVQPLHRGNVTYARGTLRGLDAFVRALRSGDSGAIRAAGVAIDRRAAISRKADARNLTNLRLRSGIARAQTRLTDRQDRLGLAYGKLEDAS